MWQCCVQSDSRPRGKINSCAESLRSACIMTTVRTRTHQSSYSHLVLYGWLISSDPVNYLPLTKLTDRNLQTAQRHPDLHVTPTCTSPRPARHPDLHVSPTCTSPRPARLPDLHVSPTCTSPRPARHPDMHTSHVSRPPVTSNTVSFKFDMYNLYCCQWHTFTVGRQHCCATLGIDTLV
jgi:hypothetical protein